MVQKYQSPVRVYKYPFELVMLVRTCFYLPSSVQFSLSCYLTYKSSRTTDGLVFHVTDAIATYATQQTKHLIYDLFSYRVVFFCCSDVKWILL